MAHQRDITLGSVVFLIAILVFAGTAQGQVKIVPVALQWQETPEWCWAASGQMIMNLRGPVNVPQCYQVNEFMGRTDCCALPVPAACVQPGWPQFDHWGFTSSRTSWGTPLNWAQVRAQIDQGKPFMFVWAWNGGGANTLVARGYINIPILGLNWLLVDNPMPTQLGGVSGNASGPFGGDLEIITYGEFVGGPGYSHTHGADVYDVSHM